MKRHFLLLSLFSLLMVCVSCEPGEDAGKDITDTTADDTTGDTSGTDNETDEESGTYQLYMNDSLISEGTIAKVGIVEGLDRAYLNQVAMSQGAVFNIYLFGFSYTVGETVVIDNESDNAAQVVIDGWDIFLTDREEMYFSKSGSLTRTSARRIIFSGVCAEAYSPSDSISFHGYCESKAFEKIQ